MKWFTHKAVAVAGALAVSAPPAALVAVLVGSVLPDMVDSAVARGDRKRWCRIHRQSSHWFGWYLLLIVLGMTLPLDDLMVRLLREAHISFAGISTWQLARTGRVGQDLLVWLGIGGLIHILLDALTPMRVPIFPHGGKKRFGIRVVSTGSYGEGVFLVAALLFIAWQFDQADAVIKEALRSFRAYAP